MLNVAALEQPMHSIPGTPQLPSISTVGPTQTSLPHDVPEPPIISSQLPEVHVRSYADARTCMYVRAYVYVVARAGVYCNWSLL